MKKVIIFSLLILAVSSTILSQEVASARLQGMGIGSAYLIEDYETDILKFPVLLSKIHKRYGALLINPIEFNYNRFTYFEKKYKTILGIHLGHEDGFGWSENLGKNISYIQIIFGNSNNVFGYKISNSEMKNHLTGSYENESTSYESIRNTDQKKTEKSLKHLLTYSTNKDFSIENDILFNFSLGYIKNKTIFDDNRYGSYDTLYDSLETYHSSLHYNDFENVIYYEYDISENGYDKCSELSINCSLKMKKMFLKRFPTNLYGEIGLIHSNYNELSGKIIVNEYVRYISDDIYNEPDSIITYTSNDVYDLKKKESNEFLLVIGSGTLYQISKRIKLFITGKSLLNYELIDEIFENEQCEEVLKEENTVFRYKGYTNFGCEFIIAKNLLIRTGSSWIIAGSRELDNYYKIDLKFTPELILKILAGISYSYSDNLQLDLAYNLLNGKEELFVSTIYKF